MKVSVGQIERLYLGQQYAILIFLRDASRSRPQVRQDRIRSMSKKKLSAEQHMELLEELKTRFEENIDRHKGIKWADVEARLKASPGKLWSLSEMELTGGEPDVARRGRRVPTPAVQHVGTGVGDRGPCGVDTARWLLPGPRFGVESTPQAWCGTPRAAILAWSAGTTNSPSPPNCLASSAPRWNVSLTAWVCGRRSTVNSLNSDYGMTPSPCGGRWWA